MLHGERIKVPTISSNEDVNEAKRNLETGAIAYIVGKNLGLDVTNHALGSIATAINENSPTARYEVFNKLYDRIDKTSQYIQTQLARVAKELNPEKDDPEEDYER